MSDTRVIRELTRHRAARWISRDATYRCTCGDIIGHVAGAAHPIPGGVIALDWWMAEHIADALDALDIGNTFTLTAPPDGIHAFIDTGADLGVFNADDWEYGTYEATHVSGFRFIPADEHMPDHLRPDIGEDRL
jgi:hypothetical protein